MTKDTKRRTPSSVALSESDRAHLLFGKAMAAWAKLERGFYAWFEHATLMDMHQAQPLYFSVTNFKSRMDLLRAALDAVTLDSPDEELFVRGAMGLAIQYNSFRNKLAHGDFTFDGLIIESKVVDRATARRQAISHTQLGIAATNFQALADLLWLARDLSIGQIPEDDPEASVKACVARVDALPRRADSAEPHLKRVASR
jgi:hypothetical protein